MTKCPVCEHTITKSVCENCGYVRIVFPETVPESIKQFQVERKRVLQNLIEEKSNQVREIQKLQDYSELHKKELIQVRSENERLEKKNNQLEQEVKSQRAIKDQIADAYLIFKDFDDYTVYPITNSEPVFFANGAGKTAAFKDKDGVYTFPIIINKVNVAFEISPCSNGFKIIDHSNTLLLDGNPVKESIRLTSKSILSFVGMDFKAYFTLRSRKR